MSSVTPGRRLAAPLRVLPIAELLLLVLLVVLPWFISDFHVIITTRMLILAILALSFDLCWGYSGIMSFGQALFFGIAGYVVALFANKAGVLQLAALVPIGMLVGLVAAGLVGWFLLWARQTPTIIFVALGTLTASYAAERLVAGWQWVGAGNGMSIWDFAMLGPYELDTGLVFYYVGLAFLLFAYLASRYLVRSQFGLVLAGMRQNERRLAFFGYRVQTFKLLVFAFAGMLAGLSGTLYSFHEGFVGPTSLGITQSTYAVLYGLFGGVGTLIGPIIGTLAIETITFVLADRDELKNYWPVVLGVILLVVVAYKPTGIMGFFLSERERLGTFGDDRGGDEPGSAPPREVDRGPA
ncbi:MAG: branched-chain amino acid ABC transporter permease [Pseudomonadota bacterium]